MIQANDQALPEIATRFNDSDRYINPNVAASLVLFLPVTDFRPEAMRVSMRSLPGYEWYEVETFNPRMDKWIEQKSYADQQSATEDALGWYPDPIAGFAAFQEWFGVTEDAIETS